MLDVTQGLVILKNWELNTTEEIGLETLIIGYAELYKMINEWKGIW